MYSLLCLLLWGLWGFILKLAYQNLSWIETYMLSSIASFVVMLFVVSYHGMGSLKLDNYTLTAIVAGLLGGGGYIFFIKALEHGKASIVIPLTALYPAITVILAYILLGEKLSIQQTIGIVLAVIAAFLLSIK